MDRPSGTGPGDRVRLIARLRAQSRSAAGLGSPLYESLLAGVADDVEAGGPCWRVLAPHAHEEDGAALPLRFMAAAHRLVLRRRAPALAVHYASVGGEAGVDGAWPVFRETVEALAPEMTELTALPCQTNEVGRSAALGPAIAWLAASHGLAVNHYEIGTSAGLNLRWDHFRYGTADGRQAWGPSDSPVDLTGHWVEGPELPAGVDVTSRMGCDPMPLDPASAADRETLTASVWADMPARHARLKGALALAREVPAAVTRAGAGEWLDEVLPDRPYGLSVVAHSVVWRYIPEPERQRITDTLARVGADATPANPLVWLRLEPRPPAMVYDGSPYPVLATTWPGGDTVELAQAQAHGQDLRWLAP